MVITIDIKERTHFGEETGSFKEILKHLPEWGKVNATIVYEHGVEEKARIGRYGTQDNCLFKYGKGRKRYGHIINASTIENVWKQVKLYIKTPEDKIARWRHTWERALKLLEESGLWTDMADNIRTALAVGYEKINKAYDLYWKDYPELSYEERNEKRTETIKAVDSRLVHKTSEGKDVPDTNIIWYMHIPAKIKTMNFGKFHNKKVREALAEAIANKKEFSHYVDGRITHGQNYDAHVSYSPEANRAWYAEEYRGCGNGHYYVALNGTHALFVEDD